MDAVAAYRLTLPINILTHSRSENLMLHDGAAAEDQELDAFVRSGDYFIMLGTLLETITQDLESGDTATANLLLDKLIQDLDYIQQHYLIIKKRSLPPRS